ncbi:helix-turn-helix transcriptional regulator [Cohnella xylanilytica]|uniref:Helix-turn-helix transcriptional regulator n=1 Tax=Cohnella xylanilytica TaxID=557555 RepID=A0A841TYR3_9BACL|nr:helix-turn-helix transcriptional regulator [Cohnella xylanilytica]MBB6690784.1 helix-turn-helix transcriptional regulator [Cohnella xylanilytica]
MIRCNLAILMAERELKMIDITEKTGIAKATIRALYHNQGKGIQFETMDTLCEFLDVSPGELFTRVEFKVDLLKVEEPEELNFKLYIEFHVGEESFTGEFLTTFYVVNGEDKLSIDMRYSKKLNEKLKSIPRIYLQYEIARLLDPMIEKIPQHKNGINAYMIVE